MSEAAPAIAKAAHVWARDALDWYVEPEASTDALLRAETFAGRVYDPCCGGGNIVRAVRRAGLNGYGCDLVRRQGQDPAWFDGTRDFLADHRGRHNIIMNPPFFRAKGAEAFIRHALAITTYKVAAFVDLKFLGGTGRANGLYAEHPPSRVWIVTPRPSCPPGEYLLAGNEAGGGTADWVWVVWDKTAPGGRTDFGWLRGAR